MQELIPQREMVHKGLHVQFAMVCEAFVSCEEVRNVMLIILLDMVYTSLSVS